MTQEEKARAYDEAKARMSRAYNSNRCTIGFMNEIFPEFKDEDERIKEEIINYFECQSRDEPCRKSIHDKWIAWIEKQGQTFTKEDTDNANKVEPKDYNGIDPHFGKPVDKVEPKFQNGQWIVWQDKCYKVNYNGCGYELIDQNGLSTSLEYGTIDENAHLWDITKDAKDGDVLVNEDGLAFIYNYYLEEQQYPFAYGGINVYGRFNLCDGLLPFTHQKVHPATKEQRDILEKAMADAGYTFDFEKKELKKISQRIISAEAKEAMYGKPTAWSEEDELKRSTLIHVVKKLQGSAIFEGLLPEELIAWLKSLKQRIKL